MKFIKKNKDGVGLALSIGELKVIRNSIDETIKAIEDWEFPIRIGVSIKEARGLASRIDKVIKQSDGKGEIIITISRPEGIIINNALNEVCNGIEVSEFEKRIGSSMADAKKLLRQAHEWISPYIDI